MRNRVYVLVEGQTEEQFVNKILTPFFRDRGLFLIPTLLVTKRVKNGPNFKGGVTSFANYKKDLQKLLKGAGGDLVTTMIDYYGLPTDFPGMGNRPTGSPKERVEHVEASLRNHFGDIQNFIPFFSLHEFEAMLFSSDDELPRVMTQMSKKPQFASIRERFPSPEAINERPDKAPSKRIRSLFPQYRKTLHGPLTADRIGLNLIRDNCSHFAWWLNELEQYTTGDDHTI